MRELSRRPGELSLRICVNSRADQVSSGMLDTIPMDKVPAICVCTAAFNATALRRACVLPGRTHSEFHLRSQEYTQTDRVPDVVTPGGEGRHGRDLGLCRVRRGV